VTRQIHIIFVLIAQLLLISCTGYGLFYDDVRLETSELEQICLQQPNSKCLLQSASAITANMSEDVSHAEALIVIAKTQYRLENNQAALNTIGEIRILVMQFNGLFELSQLAKAQQQSSRNIIILANSIIDDIQQPRDKMAALILGSILLSDNQQTDLAKIQLQKAVLLAKNNASHSTNNIDIRFFSRILPKLLQSNNTEVIEQLIDLQAKPSQQIIARAKFCILLKDHNPTLAKQQFKQLLKKWSQLANKQQTKTARAAIINALVAFDKLKQAYEIRQQQTDNISKIGISSVIIQQLTADANEQNITQAKQELVWLLRQVRQHPRPTIPVNALPQIKQQAAQDDFDLANLRAQAIADVALGLAAINQLTEAVYFAEQIQHAMGHIQGYTLTKLAKQYARQGDINTALLTMESIYRPVNRAACLTEISAQLAKNGDLNRAIIIAARINRRSWRDIANSEISILQARQNDIKTAMKTLNTIQRSYSAVYAMSEIAGTLQAQQNKR